MEKARVPLLRRLNGRPQACDPCRARKVACDHAQPICNRCRKRKQNDCVYTVTADQAATSVRKRRTTPSTRPSPPQNSHRPSVDVEVVGERATSPPAPERSTSGFDSSTLTRRPELPSDSGYLGFTSYSTVFQETRNSLTLLNGPDIGPFQTASRARPCLTDLLPPLREMCLFVVQHLPRSFSDNLKDCTGSYRPDQWIHVAVDAIVQTLRHDFAPYLAADADNRLIAEMAQILCCNSSKPFRDEHEDPQAWIRQFTGPNLRWESLGLLWTFWEMGTGPMGHPPMRYEAPDEIVNACLGYTIEISRHFSQGNDLMLYLSFRKGSMESIIKGDASLHAESPTAPYKPTLCSENKRRLFAYIFNIDKAKVSFTGRPPLIGRRYSSTPLPLDLGDEDLMSDEATITRAVQNLDARGWNTDGSVHPASLIRGRVMIAYIRDEILEIALSPGSFATSETLLDIKARQLETLATFPEKLIYQPDHLIDPNSDPDILFARLLIKMEHLQNVFFIERLLHRFGQPDEGNLLVVSFELVTLTLTFWTHKDRFIRFRRGFEWLLMAYAAPGGGILCLELLRPTFHGTHPKSSKLTRSSIIQQLSLLVGFLDWVRPLAPNGGLCADCKAIIQGVLDHNLNTVPGSGGAVDSFDWNFTTQPDFNFDLLDTFDWLRTDMGSVTDV
ncbi:hypothetical protein G7046_g9132 [Stylonectria norvegica]|nr:hypothetical protein G7046_g9132 [Stylonectria norvegica]